MAGHMYALVPLCPSWAPTLSPVLSFGHLQLFVGIGSHWRSSITFQLQNIARIHVRYLRMSTLADR